MKPVYGVLIAFAAAVVGGGVGFLIGVGFAGLAGGLAGGLGGGLLGVCAATETAKEEGLLTPQQADQVIHRINTKLAQDSNHSEPALRVDCGGYVQDANK